MNILMVVPNYPYLAYRSSGIFNEKCAHALSELCDEVHVLAPGPYVPPLLSLLVPRWRAYATIPRYKRENGVTVHRPAIPVIPKVAQSFWSNQGAFLWCRTLVRKLHRRMDFDAIVSFDLGGAGGLAWRLAKDLEIPASGWATGSDIRVSPSSSHGQALTRTLTNLDLVFYQSRELQEHAAALLKVRPEQLPCGRHVVLPRGIPQPPEISSQTRDRIRRKLRIQTNEVLVLYLGRILRQKGMLELLEAMKLAASRDPSIRCLLVGSRPGFDDTASIEKKLRADPWLQRRVTIVPECNPDDIWYYLCSADCFVFPSHREGMPNSLLEAMAMGLAAIAFAIPAVKELEDGTGAICLVPPLDSKLLGEAILRLAANPDERKRLGTKAKAHVMDRFIVRKSMGEALRRLALLTEGVALEPDKSSDLKRLAPNDIAIRITNEHRRTNAL
jgi:teichuronic acid biosynthesis glycosyltransferase TuaC